MSNRRVSKKRFTLNLVLVLALVLPIFGPLQRGVSAKADETQLSPDQTLDSLQEGQPGTVVDPQAWMIEQAVGGTVDSEILGSAGLARLEPITPKGQGSPVIERPPDPTANLTNEFVGPPTIDQLVPGIMAPNVNNPASATSTSLAEAHDLSAHLGDSDNQTREDDIEGDSTPNEGDTAVQPPKNMNQSNSSEIKFNALPTEVETQAASSVQQAVGSSTHTVYLPVLVLELGTTIPEETATLLPNTATIASFAGGQVELFAPAGAVSEPTTVVFQLKPPTPVENFATTLIRFDLKAFTDAGKPVTEFDLPLVLTNHYDPQSVDDEAQLRLYYYDISQANWQAVLSGVDPVQDVVISTLDHFTEFALLEASCNDLIFPPMPSQYIPAFESACLRVGAGTLGAQTTYPFLSGGVWQMPFTNGNLIHNPADDAAYYVATDVLSEYQGEGGPAGWLGKPVDDTNPNGAPEIYRDEYHDFRQGSFQLFEFGFIGYTGGNIEAHLNYPQITDVVMNSQSNGDGTVDLVFGASVDPAPNSSAVVYAILDVEFDDGRPDWHVVQTVSGAGQSVGFTYPDPVTNTTFVKFHWALDRIAFSTSDDLVGYAPCLYYDHQIPYGPLSVAGIYQAEVNCDGGGGPGGGDFIPPTITFFEIWPDGLGNLSILVQIFDDSGTIASYNITGGPGTLSQPLVPRPDLGPNIYGAAFSNIPINQVVNFTVTATDPAGNSASASGSTRSQFRSLLGTKCFDPCSGWEKPEGNPVAPGTGNKVEELPIVTVPGPGDSDIDITLTYNSQDSDVGLTGHGWSFPYQMKMTPRNNMLLNGFEVLYPDGRIVLFADNGDGTYSPATHNISDRLEQTAEGYVLTMKSLESYVFDDNGRLVAQRDRNNNEIQFVYSGDQLILISNDAGRTLDIGYNADGYISTIDAPEGKHYEFNYTDSRLTSFTNARNLTWKFEYEERYVGVLLDVDGQPYEAYDYFLTAVRTPEGHYKNQQNYDGQGRVVEQWVGEREYRSFEYQEDQTIITDAFDNVKVNHYDQLHRLVQVDYADGTSEFFEYDADFNRTFYQDQEGRQWNYTYDDRRNRLTEDGPMGWHREWKYNELDRVILAEDALGRETVYTYDSKGNLTRVTRPGGTFSDFIYDNRGLPTDIYDFNGSRTHNEYDPVTGDLTMSLDAENYQTAFVYDDLGRVVETTLANTATWTYVYDGNDNVTDTFGPLGYHVSYTYDDNDNLILETDPNGGEIEYEYNTAELLERVEGQLDYDIALYEYDLMSNLVRFEDAEGREWTYEYDEIYRRTAEHAPEDTHTFYGYDDVGNITDVTWCNSPLSGGSCADSRVTHSEYDDLDRVTTLTDNYVNGQPPSDDVNVTTQFSYDLAGNLLTNTDPSNHTTTYAYNPDLDWLEETTDAENQVTTYSYDNMGNLLTMVDAEGRSWAYEYDKVYNQTAVHGPEDTHTFYSYDGLRYIVDMTRCNSALDVNGDCPVNQVTHYEYDLLERLVTLVENYIPGQPLTADTNVTTTFAYDLAENLLLLTDANGNPTNYEYDPMHRLIKEVDAEFQETGYEYDRVDNLIRLVNPRTFATDFEYDGLDRLVRQTDADGNIWEYAYDRHSNLINLIDPVDVVTHYTYDGMDRMEQMTQNYVLGGPSTSDQNVITTYEYDAAGNLRFVFDPRGGYVTEYQYDKVNRRILTIDNENGETEFEYDKVGNLTAVIDANNHTTTFVYDGLNRQVEVVNPETHSVQYSYDRLSNLRVLTDGRGSITTFQYDGMNRVILSVDAMGGQWIFAYDPMGNPVQSVDANGHANDTYTYDKVYRVLTITDAEGYSDTFTYDPNGNQLTWTDGNSHVTTYTYDVLDRMETMTNAELEIITYEYDPLGNQTKLIEADGIITRYDYDPLYRLVTVNQNDQPGEPESADVNVDTHYVYDEVGNLLTIIDAELHETNFTYDGMNRLLTEIDADGNLWQYGYDFVGNRIWRIDANDKRTDYTYYPDNQPETISYELDGTTVEYTYDENNNQTEMVDHLGTTTWTYDPLNRAATVTDALNRHLGYGYDAVGNRTSLTYHDGRVVQYTYYDNDWLKTAIDPENNVTSYERDGVGMTTTTTNPNETITTATYDKVNRMLTLVNKETTGAQKTNSAFTYTYNDVGHRTEMIAEYGWRNPAIVTSTYTYDGLRRLVRDEDSEGMGTDYTFDRVGNRLVLDTNDDSLSPRPFDEKTVYYSYSDANRLLSLVGNTHPGSPGRKWQDNVGQTIYAFRHEVAAQQGNHIVPVAAANLLQMADDLIDLLEGNPKPSEGEVTVALEAIRVQVQSDWAGGLITSDGIANSLLVKLDMGDSATNNGANDEWQSQTFTYDANGNRINTEHPGPQGPHVQGTDYTYDPENRLIVNLDYQMNQHGNRIDRAITTMEHDGGGRRLVKTYDPNEGGGGAKRVEYVFDGWDPVAEYNQWNPQYENFYRGDMNRIITMHHFPSGTAGQMYWYHYDGLGSVSGLTKQHGQSHHNYRYEPYGQIEMPPGNFTDPHNHYTFTGQEWDENLGMYEFFAREYDPITGVWLTQDTYRGEIINPMSIHRMQYVWANPINHIDAYGNEVETDETKVEFFDESYKEGGGCRDYLSNFFHLCGQYSAGSASADAGLELDELDEIGLGGDLTSVEGTGGLIIGNEYFGLVGELGGYGPKAEGIAGFDDGEFGLNAGVKGIGGEGRVMINAANLASVGIGAGLGWELEFGIKYDKKRGIKLNVGPFEGQLVISAPRSQSYYEGNQKSLRERWNDLWGITQKPETSSVGICYDVPPTLPMSFLTPVPESTPTPLPYSFLYP